MAEGTGVPSGVFTVPEVSEGGADGAGDALWDASGAGEGPCGVDGAVWLSAPAELAAVGVPAEGGCASCGSLAGAAIAMARVNASDGASRHPNFLTIWNFVSMLS